MGAYLDFTGNILNIINKEYKIMIDAVLVECLRDISVYAIKAIEIIKKLDEYGIEVISMKEKISSKDLEFNIKIQIAKYFEEMYKNSKLKNSNISRSMRMKELWKNPEYREIMIKKMKKAKELKKIRENGEIKNKISNK